MRPGPLVGLAFLILLFSTTVTAVCPQPPPPLCAEFFRSDLVLVGTVVSKASVLSGEEDFIEGWNYRIRVEKTLRGKHRDFIEAFTENTSVRLTLEIGRKYLLFAYKEKGRLALYGCGNSKEWSGDAPGLQELTARRAPSAIVGRIAG